MVDAREKASTRARKKGPKHERVREILRRRIQEGVYPPGSRLPSESELPKLLKVGNQTIRHALNDLVREEMQDLLAQPHLSSDDQQRLQTHFEAIRDLEVNMSCQLSDGEIMAMQTISQAAEDNGNRIVVAEMMMDLIAFAFACDLNTTATLQIGTGNDSTRYTVNGDLQNTFHRISHRIDSDRGWQPNNSRTASPCPSRSSPRPEGARTSCCPSCER